MKNLLYMCFICTLLLESCSSSKSGVLDYGNTVQRFDANWKFNPEEVSDATSPTYDDASWRTLDLPHDWSIEGEFSKDNASFSRGGWLPTGKVTYRKYFSVPKENRGKRYVIYFDGAYRNSEVYINGHFLGKRPLGYIPFHYDLTKHLDVTGDNVITVKLDNSEQPGSRWYSGTGIYRSVNLIITDQVYVPVWGNYIVANTVSDGVATIDIETKVQNDSDQDKEVTVRHFAYAPDGEEVASSEKTVLVSTGREELANLQLEVNDPMLWDMENPNQYTIRTELLVDGNLTYSEGNKTGIRTLDFSATEGFKLNGNVVKLKGVCLHHAGGPLGAAIYRRTIERQLEKLREMGANAVRTAHNPFSEEFLMVCDSMGFLVMNEMFDEWEVVKEPATSQNGKKIRIPVKFYAHLFKEWADRDLTDFLLRDRNHASVIMWSTGNEIDQMHEEEGAVIGRRLADIVHKYDYRPLTNGVNGYGWNKWPNQDAVATSDIYGYNYILDEGMNIERDSFPDIPVVITEHQSAQSFYPRATYLYGERKKEWWNKLGYDDREAFEWVEKRGLLGEAGMDAWEMVKKRPYVTGLFIWTGWDYLGEVIPFGWPARSSTFAPIDLAGFPKDGYYFYQSQWTEKPMVHIFPHWNLRGMEGKMVSIHGFTNGDEVELFQDGRSLGRKTNDRNGVEYQTWEVVYRPGELKAVAYRDGKQVAEKVVKTAAEPAKIEIDVRRKEMQANGRDLIYVECTIVDKNGNEVPTADNLLEFEVSGPAKIAGVANGNNMGLEPFKAKRRSAFNGKCLAILQSTKEAGAIHLTVKSDGLESTTVNFSAN